MRLLRLACTVFMALIVGYGAARDPLQIETSSDLELPRVAAESQGWRNKGLVGGSTTAVTDDDLAYGDDVLPVRNRSRNKRRRRKRLRQRPPQLEDYDDTSDTLGLPSYRPRQHYSRGRYEDSHDATFSDLKPFPAIEDRPHRPRSGGRRRKPQLRFVDDPVVNTGTSGSTIVEEGEFILPRRRPNAYRKPDQFVDEAVSPEGQSLNTFRKPDHFGETSLPEFDNYRKPDRFVNESPPLDEQTNNSYKVKNEKSELPQLQQSKQNSNPTFDDDFRPRKTYENPASNQFNTDKSPENLPTEEFKLRRSQNTRRHPSLPDGLKQFRFIEQSDNTNKFREHANVAPETSKDTGITYPAVTFETEQSNIEKVAEKQEAVKISPTNLGSKQHSTQVNVQDSVQLKEIKPTQKLNTDLEFVQIKQQETTTVAGPIVTYELLPTEIFKEETLQHKHYQPQLQDRKTSNSPQDMEPVSVSLHELLKLKNITLDDVLKENQDTESRQKQRMILPKPDRTSLGPFVRRLPTASEFFAKRKNVLQTVQNNREDTQTNINQMEVKGPIPNLRSRNNVSTYGHQVPNGSINLRGSSASKIYPKEETTTMMSKQATRPEARDTPTMLRKHMPLNMQESKEIDPINIGIEDETAADGQLTSQDREMAKQLLKSRINEANNSSKVPEFLQSSGVRLPPIKVILKSPEQYNQKEVSEPYRRGQVFDVEIEPDDVPVRRKIPLEKNTSLISRPRDEILDLLKTESGSQRLGRILASRNMSLQELIEHRERGSSQHHLPDIFKGSKEATELVNTTIVQQSRSNLFTEDAGINTKNKVENSSKEVYTTFTNIEDMFNIFKTSQETLDQKRNLQNNSDLKFGPKVPTLISIVNPLVYSQNDFGKNVEVPPLEAENNRGSRLLDSVSHKKEINISVPPSAQIHESFNADPGQRAIDPLQVVSTTKPIRDDINSLFNGQVQMVTGNIMGSRFESVTTNNVEEPEEPSKEFASVLPTAVKSAIIASSVIFGLAIFVFLAIFMMCKWRQKRTRRRFANGIIGPRVKSPILSDQMYHDMRKMKRTLSPVLVNRDMPHKGCNVHESDTYVEPRRYYLWRTIRKTLRYK